MKKPAFGRLFILVILVLLSACSPTIRLKTGGVQPQLKPEPKTVVINRAHNGGSVKLLVGDTLLVVLPTTPGTGYAWQVVRKSRALHASSGSHAKAKGVKSARLSSRNQKRFFFRAGKSGNSRLRLVYRRPFEQAEPAAAFEIYVRVK